MFKLKLLQYACRIIIHLMHYFDQPKEARLLW